jgi:crotonobetaine/carnitine-CoA ligase
MFAEFSPAERTLSQMLQRQAERHGDRPLFRIGDVAWSYADVPLLAAAAAGRLRDAGLKPGDRLAVICPNRAEFLELYLGCAWSGVIMVPINVASRGPQLQHVLSNSGARVMAVTDELRHVLDHVDCDVLALETVWSIDALPPRGVPMPPHPSRPGDTVAILYTSGTTGPSKGVCCPHAQMYWWGLITGRLLELTADDVLCTTLPMFHTNALNTFHQALLHGAAMVLEPRFSASGFWPAMVATGASVTYVLGAMVPILMAQPAIAAERAHRLRVALAPGVPGHLQVPFTARTGLQMIDGYGSTETNFTLGITVNHQRPGLMGPVVDGFEAQVVDEHDTPVPDGIPGELVLRAHEPFAFATGYWAMPDKTVEAWRNLRFHTGDRVVREADGWYRFMDRLKDAIRRRGENISAFEVEQVLLTHPEIAGAAVFPVRSELAEDEVMAAIIRKPGSTLSPAAICAFCAPLLARFAIPRFIDFVGELPLTENGKVRKFMLIERGVGPGTWDRSKA